MKFIPFAFGIIILLWTIYEITKKESTLMRTFTKEENPKKYWAQIVAYFILGILILFLSFQ